MALFRLILVVSLFCCIYATSNKTASKIGAIKPATDSRENAAEEIERVQTALKVTKSFVTVIGKLSKALGPVASILSAFLGYFASLFGIHSGESPEMKLMKKEFGEINMKLDTITQDLDLIKDLILDASIKSAYISDEHAILNGFHSLQILVNELHNVTCTKADDCQRQRLRIGERYLPHLDIRQNMDNIYRGATDSTMVFSEPLLDHINRTYQCDVPKVEQFTEGIIKLAFKEQQVTMVYNMLGGSAYSITHTLNNWMKRIYKLKDYSKTITSSCLDNIKHFMLKDITSPKYQSNYQSNFIAATAIRNDLVQKYPWLDWIIMAFDTDKDTEAQAYNIDGQFWSFPGVNNGRRNILASSSDNGTFKTEAKAEIVELLHRILPYPDELLPAVAYVRRVPRKAKVSNEIYFKYIVNGMKEHGVWKYIKSFTLLRKEKNWHYAKDDSHYERFIEYTDDGWRLFFTLKSVEERLFLKSDDDRASLTRCHLPCKRGQNSCEQCENGLCDHYPYSSNFFCDCRNYFHGERCEIRSNISMATNLEVMFTRTMTIPKLTDIYFEIKDVSSFIGSSLGNIQETIHRLSTKVDKAFVQLHESLSKQFRMIGIITAYGEQIKSLQYFIELFSGARHYNDAEKDSGLHDLAEAVLGAQRYNGIRRWLHDFNILINGTTEFTLAPAEPLLITYMDQYKDKACTQDYKDAIDNVWRQIMLLQQRGYMIWVQALHILNMPTDLAIEQYEEYTTSQIETLKRKTCSLVIPGTESINCTDGFYLNERIELTVTCKPNYYLVGNGKSYCKSRQTFCYPCNCNLNGSASDECDDQTGKCSCNDKRFGDKCESRNCTWSSWSDWSVCPCGYGNQTRTRSIEIPPEGAGTCYGTSSETRPCVFHGCCGNEFHCSISKTCIQDTRHCNNRQDCAHNEDESDCCETRYTPWGDNGRGDTRYLDRHHLDCGSPAKMITKFRLEASKYPENKVRYMYTCCRFAVPFCSMRSVSNTLTEANHDIRYLDKQSVDCGTHSVMNAFRLFVTPNFRQQRYQYQCCDIKPSFQQRCTSANSGWTTESDSQNFYLDRQDFQCAKGSYLSYFHLERQWPGHKLIHYNYRCCYVY